MKKVVLILSVTLLLFALCACSQNDEAAFASLREKVSAAGYEVSEVYVDSKFEDVVSAFAVKVSFDANTVATIPIILSGSEKAAEKNCALFGSESIKIPIRNGKIFSYPGKDYPEAVINLITAIVNNDTIPKNLNTEK